MKMPKQACTIGFEEPVVKRIRHGRSIDPAMIGILRGKSLEEGDIVRLQDVYGRC